MNTKSKDFGLIIEKYDSLNDFEVKSEALKEFLDEADYISYYAFILHWCDFDEYGNSERPHFHVVVTTTTSYAKNTILNDFAKSVVKNKNAISIRALVDKSKMIGYLVHKDQPEWKHRYSCQDIITNDFDKTIDTILHPIQENALSIEEIINVVERSDNLTEVYVKLGLKNSRIYRNVIKDVWDYYANKKEIKLKGLKK